jgi:hypothetical protein
MSDNKLPTDIADTTQLGLDPYAPPPKRDPAELTKELQKRIMDLAKNPKETPSIDEWYNNAVRDYTRGATQDAYDGLTALLKAEPSAATDKRVALLLRRCEVALNLR